MRVGPFAFRYQGNGPTPCQYIDTTRKAIDCATARVEFLLSVIEHLFLSLTVEALQGKICRSSLPSGGVGQFEPRFHGKGSSPCQYIDTTRKAIDYTTTLPLKVSDMKLCSRLLVLYCRNCLKEDKFRYLIPILRKLGAA